MPVGRPGVPTSRIAAYTANMEHLHDPHRQAIFAVLPDDLRVRLSQLEEHFHSCLREAVNLKQEADDWIRSGNLRNHFEHLEADLEKEHAERQAYFREIFAGQIKAILEYWKDSDEE